MKRTLKKTLCCLMAALMLASVGCQGSGTGQTEPDLTGEQLQATDMTTESTTPPPETTAPTAPPETTAPEETKATEPKETKPVETQPKETEPPETKPVETTPPETQPPATNPPATEPIVTEPPATEPPATEPPHEHSYSATGTVAATCNSQGYTTYMCSCGASYSDNYTPILGHSWGDWTTTVEATSEAEGQQTRTCTNCGAAETQAMAKLPAEVIDTAALAAYGVSYAQSRYGCIPCPGLRDGYYPAYCCKITSMEDGYSEVAECVTDTILALYYANAIPKEDYDAGNCKARMDVEVTHDHEDIYYVWVYYG